MIDINNLQAHPTRGQIYMCNLGTRTGSVQSGSRPVIILQSDDLNPTSPTVVVAPITSVLKKKGYVSHVILPDMEGLPKRSMVILEQVCTVNVFDLEKYCGCLHDETTWKVINNAIKKTLGLWITTSGQKKKVVLRKEVTCLCNNCISYYRNNPEYKIRRLNRIKDRCDRCNYSYGYDYLITEQREG